MEQFRTYLKQIESNIPESDMNYFKKVTKPVYEQLMSEIERRFELLRAEIEPALVSISQSQIVTGYVDIYDFRSASNIVGNFEPIIDVNQNIESAIKNETGDTNIRLKVGKEGYLFSFLSNLSYLDYEALDNCERIIEISYGKTNTHQKVIFKINSDYSAIEEEMRALFCSNRPQESYFDIPMCRRFIDVYLDSQDDVKGIVEITVSDLSGKICIPVWNILCDEKLYQGSRKNQILPSEKKVIMPYGLTGEQNQFSVSFENCPDNIVDALVKIKDYNCSYFFTKYFDKESVLKLYTSDKKVWGPSFCLYGISKKTGIVSSLLSGKIDYECLEGCSNLTCRQSEITEALVHYFANIFYEITRLKVYKIHMSDNEVDISFVSYHDSELNMDKEYLEFLLSQYNSSFMGKTFKGRVVERG